MNILLVSRGWPTVNDPKWGCFEKDQAEALKDLGHNVRVICIDCRVSLKPYIPKISNEIINGIKYTSYRGLPQSLVALIAGERTAIKMEQHLIDKLYSIVKDEGFVPDVLYAHFVLNSCAASILKEKYGLPYVVIEHSSELVKEKLPSIVKIQARTAYTQAEKLIAVSDFLKYKIKDSFDKDSTVVPNMLGKEFLSLPSHFKKKKSL